MTFSGLGKGISLRRSFLKEFAERLEQNDPTLTSKLDWVEVIPENFMGRGGFSRRALLKVAEQIPMAFHGVSLSIGSVDELDWDYLSQVKKLAGEVGARWFTDHVSYSSVNGVQVHDLLPLPFTGEAIRHVVARVKQVQDFLGIPFGLENPSYYAIMPGSEMSEVEFISEILEQADCGLLLDVNNVYVNSFNHSGMLDQVRREGASETAMQAARVYLSQIPWQRVIEVHVAGHREFELAGQIKLLDTHGATVPDCVRSLLEEFHQKMPVKTLLLERENNIPPLDEILEEIESIWQGLRRFNTRITIGTSAPENFLEHDL